MPDRLTVLHGCHSWLPTTQVWLYTQVRHLPAYIASHIICNRTLNLDRFPFSRIHSLADAPWWRRYANKLKTRLHISDHTQRLIRIAAQEDGQLLHSHFGGIGWQYAKAAEKAGVRHVVTFYGRDVSLPVSDSKWHQRYEEMFRKVDRVICEGPYMASSLASLGCPTEKLAVHHLGVSVDSIPLRPRSWAPHEPLRVLISAAFREKKGIPYAIEALGQLNKEVPVEVTIVGDAKFHLPGSVQEKSRILSVIQRYGLDSRTRLLGFQSHNVLMEEAYRHHVFLAPSVTASNGDSEGGLPVALIEMAASGMPVVSTTHCDIPELIEHGQTGLMVAERDVAGLVDNLRWLVSNPGQWGDMVVAARQRVETEFNAVRQGERLAEIYLDVLRDLPEGPVQARRTSAPSRPAQS